jgi:hypothetical protein
MPNIRSWFNFFVKCRIFIQANNPFNGCFFVNANNCSWVLIGNETQKHNYGE